MSRVVCLVEHDGTELLDSSLRALTFARRVGVAVGAAAGGEPDIAAAGGEPDVVAVLVGAAGPGLATQLARYGVRQGFCARSPELTGFASLAWARALAEIASSPPAQAVAVVAAGTDYGSEVLANLGALSGLPMAANCFEISASEASGTAGTRVWRFSRQRWGGSLIEDGTLEGEPGLFTVATDAVAPAPVGDAPTSPAELCWFQPPFHEGDLAVRATESRQPTGGVSLASARVVVSGGRGVGGPEGFSVLDELAGLLGGAVGVSRVVTSLGWKPHSQQVGQTGTRVTPDLYLACGISGAIQHLAGCQSAKTMIAINTDPSAAIMQRADYAVIGDLHTVLPALVEALKARRAGS